MRYAISLAFSLLWAQHALSMGARVQLMQSRLSSSTDETSSLTSYSRTHKAGLVGFFDWGWTPHIATGMEIAYQGVGQEFYGVGVNGDNYTAALSLHYLRVGLTMRGQHAWERWGLWGGIAPSLAFLTQADLEYQGDSLPLGSLVFPQVIQNTLAYLSQSTNPDDRLTLLRMFRRTVPALHLAGGLRVRLAPQVWLLGLLAYERSFGDIERKGYQYDPESPPVYDGRRRPVGYELLGIQLGVQYEVPISH